MLGLEEVDGCMVGRELGDDDNDGQALGLLDGDVDTLGARLS